MSNIVYPGPNVPMTDSTGKVTPIWHAFLSDMWGRVGGAPAQNAPILPAQFKTGAIIGATNTGAITFTGTVTGGSIATSGTVTGGSIATSGTVTGGSIATSGTVVAQGTVSAAPATASDHVTTLAQSIGGTSSGYINMTSSRSLATTYTNNSSRSIFVSIVFTFTISNANTGALARANLNLDNEQVCMEATPAYSTVTNSYVYLTVTGLVHPGISYFATAQAYDTWLHGYTWYEY